MCNSLNFFRSRREELGLTQRDIALRLNITTSTVSQWECDDVLPRAETWDAIADVYGVSAERIAKEILKSARSKREAASATS